MDSSYKRRLTTTGLPQQTRQIPDLLNSEC